MKTATIAEFIADGSPAVVSRAIEECARENGDKLIGNPTVLSTLMALRLNDGTTASFIVIEDHADPTGWWDEWARVHGKQPTEIRWPDAPPQS